MVTALNTLAGAPRPTNQDDRRVTIRSGDTLATLAAKHGTTADAFQQANPQLKNPDLIFPGQVLKLPAAAAAPQQLTVRSGDTLEALAATHSTTTAALRQANPQLKNPNLITPGQVLKLPSTPGAAAPSPASSVAAAPQLPTPAEVAAQLQARQRAAAGGRQIAARVVPQSPAQVSNLLPKTVGSATTAKDANVVATQVRGGPMKEGDSGPAVLAMQRLLGFSAGGQTGVYGPTTRAAVEAFQNQHLGMTTSSPGYGQFGKTTLAAVKAATESASIGAVTVSPQGRAQMDALLKHARSNTQGGSRGDCMAFVWGYMTRSGYGKLDNWNDLPGMNGALARGLPDHLNASAAHLKEAGLQRLDTSTTPPIKNPHDPRIPPGAVIVVAPGSYGTSHPTAGDIVVKGSRSGEFINDGPRMDYGTQGSWYGRILGVYVPE